MVCLHVCVFTHSQFHHTLLCVCTYMHVYIKGTNLHLVLDLINARFVKTEINVMEICFPAGFCNYSIECYLGYQGLLTYEKEKFKKKNFEY